MTEPIPHCSHLIQMKLCPGSFQAQSGLPEHVMPEAESGKRVHQALNSFFHPKPDPESILDNEREEFIFDWFIAEVENVIKKNDGLEKLESELPIKIQAPSNETLLEGTLDLLLWCKNGAVHLFEFKTGYISVDQASENLQLAGYIIGAFSDFEEEIYGHLLQAAPEAEEKHTVTIYKPQDMQEAYEEIKRIVSLARSENAKRIPGIVQCKYCLARGTEHCPESRKLITDLAIKPEIALTPQQRSDFLQKCLVAEKIIEKVKTEAKRLLKENPDSVPGFALGNPKTLRSLSDVESAFDYLQKIGFTGSEYTACLSFSFPNAADILATKFKEDGMTKKRARELVEKSLEAITVAKQSSPSLRFVGEK